VKQDHWRRGALAGPGQVDVREPLAVDLDVPGGAPPGPGQARCAARDERVDDRGRPERHPAQKQAAGHAASAQSLQFLVGGPCHDADNNSVDLPVPSGRPGCGESRNGVHNGSVAFEIVVVWVGRRREPWESLCGEYRQRIRRFAPVREQVVRPARGDDRTRLRLEGNAIRAALPPEAWTVCLDRKGRNLSSRALAAEVGRLRSEWQRPVAWIVGSDLGLDPRLLKSSRFGLSLGSLTLPHELARLTVFEQIYRSFTILEGINYHRRPFH